MRNIKNTNIHSQKHYGSPYRTEADQKSHIIGKLRNEAGALKQN